MMIGGRLCFALLALALTGGSATAQSGQVRVYGTQSSHGTWLFAPRDGGGANS